MKNLLTLLLLLLISQPAFSVGYFSGEIERIRVDSREFNLLGEPNARAYVDFKSNLLGLPGVGDESPAACGSGYPSSLGISTNTNAGKAAYSMMLTALATGSTVFVIGRGECTHFGLIEDMDYGYIYPAGTSPDEAVPDVGPLD